VLKAEALQAEAELRVEPLDQFFADVSFGLLLVASLKEGRVPALPLGVISSGHTAF